MNRGDRGSRGWVFTINNYVDAQCGFLKGWEQPKYLVVGKEVGTSGTPHLQGYVYFKDAVSASALQQHLTGHGMWPGAWHQPARGGPEANKAYCSKEHLLVEKGEPPSKGPGHAIGTPLDRYVSAVKNGDSLHSLWESHTNVMIRNNAGATAMRNHYMDRRLKPEPKIFVLWGKTGTGKSKWARDSFGSDADTVYWVSPGYGRLWWGGYDGQETTVFDDFTPDQLPMHHFKLLTDRYSYRVEGKGTQMPFVSKYIVFTSNVDPKRWYRSWDLEESQDLHWKAVQRRLEGSDVYFDGKQQHLLYKIVPK